MIPIKKLDIAEVCFTIEKNEKNYYYVFLDEDDNFYNINFGQMVIDYFDFDYREVYAIIENCKNLKYIELIEFIVGELRKSHSEPLSKLIVNEFVTATNSLIDGENYFEDFYNCFDDMYSNSKTYQKGEFANSFLEHYKAYPQKNDDAKYIIACLVHSLGMEQKYLENVFDSLFKNKEKVYNYLNSELFMYNQKIEYYLRPTSDMSKNLLGIDELFTINDIKSFFNYEMTKILQHQTSINKCENCGSYFIPSSRSDEIYCDRILKGTRTCKQVGYENKDEYIKAYRTSYKTRNAAKNRNINNNSHAEGDFKQWVYAAKLKLEEAQSGNITLEVFKNWLKE